MNNRALLGHYEHAQRTRVKARRYMEEQARRDPPAELRLRPLARALRLLGRKMQQTVEEYGFALPWAEQHTA